MKNHSSSSGFAWLPILVIILVLTVAGGGAYYYVHQNTTSSISNSQQATTTSATTQATTNVSSSVSVKPSQLVPSAPAVSTVVEGSVTATIDKGSLTTGSATPTITGTFSSGVSTIDVIIGLLPLPASNAAKGFTGFSGMLWSNRATLAGNTYSDVVSSPLSNGTYYIGIYERTNVPTNTGAAVYNSPFTDTLLTSGTLTVTNGGKAPIGYASIDQNSLSASESASSVTITGSANNVNSVIVSVKMTGSNGKTLFTSGAQPVSNGKWQVIATDQANGVPTQFPAGKYIVGVFDSNNEFLAAGTLTVQ